MPRISKSPRLFRQVLARACTRITLKGTHNLETSFTIVPKAQETPIGGDARIKSSKVDTSEVDKQLYVLDVQVDEDTRRRWMNQYRENIPDGITFSQCITQSFPYLEMRLPHDDEEWNRDKRPPNEDNRERRNQRRSRDRRSRDRRGDDRKQPWKPSRERRSRDRRDAKRKNPVASFNQVLKMARRSNAGHTTRRVASGARSAINSTKPRAASWAKTASSCIVATCWQSRATRCAAGRATPARNTAASGWRLETSPSPTCQGAHGPTCMRAARPGRGASAFGGSIQAGPRGAATGR